MSPEVGVAGTFVVIVDRLITAIKAREESRQRLINDIVAPYFDQLEGAYSAYLATLRKAKKMLESGQAFPVVYSEIESLRGADLILRDKVREMADAYEGELSYPDVKAFFGDASCLFGYWSGYHNSGTLRVMTALQEPGTYSPEFVTKSINMVIEFSEQRWRELARQYALIRAKYLQPIAVTTKKETAANRLPDGRFHRLWHSVRRRFITTT
jgi:hypothetical protein